MEEAKKLIDRFIEDDKSWFIPPSRFDYRECGVICKYVKKLEAENEKLRGQAEHYGKLIETLADESTRLAFSYPLLDCRICDYSEYCKREKYLTKPAYELCEEAILSYCKDVAEKEVKGC